MTEPLKVSITFAAPAPTADTPPQFPSSGPLSPKTSSQKSSQKLTSPRLDSPRKKFNNPVEIPCPDLLQVNSNLNTPGMRRRYSDCDCLECFTVLVTINWLVFTTLATYGIYFMMDYELFSKDRADRKDWTWFGVLMVFVVVPVGMIVFGCMGCWVIAWGRRKQG